MALGESWRRSDHLTKPSVVRICIPLNTDNNIPGVKDQIFLNHLFWWEEELQGSYVSFSKVLNVRADLGQCDRSDWLKFCLQWAQGRVWIQCGHVTTQGVSGKIASLNQEKAIYSTPGSKIEKIFQSPVPRLPTELPPIKPKMWAKWKVPSDLQVCQGKRCLGQTSAEDMCEAGRSFPFSNT